MKKIMLTGILSLTMILAACGSSQIEDFSHISHRGEAVSLESLKGEPWLATFIFTSCETVCPPMTMNMVEIQDELASKGIEDYQIVAFSVDPVVDTPEKMAEYLAKYPVPDESKWQLLTGYTQEYIAEYAKDNFKSFVKNDPESDQVIHGTSFYLMDQDGEVAYNYDGYNDVPVKEIREDLEKLIKE